MFQTARIRLTVWYVIISLFVSAIFSIAIFARLHRDFEFNQTRFENRFQRFEPLDPDLNFRLDQQRQDMQDLEDRLVLNLLLINAIILAISAVAGYFLAGRTLEPIADMVDKQDQFIADASHELRTPLTAMKTSIEVNLRDKQLNAEQAKKILKENLADVETMKLLTDNLLSLARLQSSADLPKNDLSILAVLQSAITGLERTAKEKDIKLKLSGKDAVVYANKDQLTELFTLFIDNAIKYSKEKSSVSVATTVQKSMVEIAIKDKGVGINKSDLPHIFERFYRADKSRSHHDKDGYGLGLAIAKDIVDALNGSISVSSKINEGSTFIVHLPRKAA